LETELSVGEHKLGVSLRVGAAVVTGKDVAPEQLIERAVVALDYARTNKKRMLLYNDSFPDPKKFLALLADMTRGIERGEFHIVYQPKAHAADGDIVGAEALMRWDHPIEGPLPPDLFITMAEETGAIDQLTLWTLRRVIEDQRYMRSLGLNQTLSVNLSGRTLSDAEFRETAIKLIRENKADLCLEITETAVITDPEAAVATIAAFRQAGIRVSIDDYGVGLSSLSYLKQIAADELKIDKSLISDLLTKSRDRLIVKSTIDLAHALGMCVIAEGVENDATRVLLASMACDCVQGYLIGHPMRLEKFVSEMSTAPASRLRVSNA
jgi:EAL domain-containing protein (putative c-di-GMP-specific phosphodiesterase class I)